MHQMIRSTQAEHAPLMSRIVAGAWRMSDWNWTPQERLRWIEQCVEMGVTTFDHADIYGGYTVERLFGEALALKPELRQQLQLVSKCGICLVTGNRPAHRVKHYDTSASHIIRSAEQSLLNLGTDSIELLLIHRPDPLMDADAVAEAFTHLQLTGKVQSFGVSNFSPAQFELVQSRFPLVTNQIELHPLHLAPLHDGTLEQCQQRRIQPMIWSPLAGGRLLTGQEEQPRRVRAVLESIGARHDASAVTVAFAWLLRHPSRPIPVAGSRRIEAMRDAVSALDLQLNVQEWTEIWMAGSGHEVP